MSENVLEVDRLVKQYGPFRAVNGISFVVPKGTIVGLLGPNGAGKTTTIQMLLGITIPSSGTINMNVRRVTAILQQELFITSRAYEVLADIFVFPLMSMVVFGFLSLYLAGNTNPQVAHSILLGIVVLFLFITANTYF